MRAIPWLSAVWVAASLPVATASAAVVAIRADDCAQILRHVPTADVAYQPGVDVDGDPVVPADLNGGATIRPPSQIEIPITVELDQRFGIPATPGLYKAEAEIGKVTYKDGQAWFNGQALETQSEAALIAACREHLKHQQ